MYANRIRLMLVVFVVVTLLASPGIGYALGGGTLGGADASFLGEADSDLAGGSVASAGDVNGDGYADVLVGAPRNGAGGTDAGAAYLVLGGPGGWGPGASRGWGQGIDLGSAGVIRYTGEAAGDRAGYSVTGAGDVNGDGYADVLVGAHYNDAIGNNAGVAYLVLGSASPISGSLASAVRYTGEAAGDYAGTSVAGAGDVNGDGYADVLVGAYGNDAGGTDAGAAYLVLGSANPVSSSLASAVRYTGEAVNDGASASVAGAGDVNGDGYADVLVGAHYNDAGGNNAGAAYLVLGGPGGWGPGASRGWGQGIDLSSASVISYTGETAGDNAGWSVAGAGDVNGDGYADVLVGAHYNDAGGGEAGAAYLVLGSATPSGGSLASAVRYTGEAVSDCAGESVAGAGDVNGDGYADVLVGAHQNDAGGGNAGAAYLVTGSASPISGSLASAVRYTGEAANDQASASVAGAGDVNGDGYADVLVGAHYNDAGGGTAGAAYLLFSDYLAPGAPPIRQRQRLLDNSGDALPVNFEQAGVRVDLASSALPGGDVTVERHVFHPCRTDWRLQMPIWSIASSKHHNAPEGTSTTDLVFHYTDAQLAGMVESNLKIWARPIGQPCGEWTQVLGSIVTPDLNLVTVSGLAELGKQYTLSADQPPTAIGALYTRAQQPSSGLVWAVPPLALALVAACVYGLWRRPRPTAVAKPERLQRLAQHPCRGFVRRPGDRAIESDRRRVRTGRVSSLRK